MTVLVRLSFRQIPGPRKTNDAASPARVKLDPSAVDIHTCAGVGANTTGLAVTIVLIRTLSVRNLTIIHDKNGTVGNGDVTGTVLCRTRVLGPVIITDLRALV